MDVIICTTAPTDEEARALAESDGNALQAK